MGEREWIAKVKSVLKNLVDIEYERVTSQTLWGIRLVILVKPEHIKKISHVEHTQVCFLLFVYCYIYCYLSCDCSLFVIIIIFVIISYNLLSSVGISIIILVYCYAIVFRYELV